MGNRHLNTLEMEVGLMEYYCVGANMVVPNVGWGMSLPGYRALHECDLLVLSGSGYATEVGIKVDRQDLSMDKEEFEEHSHPFIKYLYFAVPDYLKGVALGVVPERAGVLVVTRKFYNTDQFDYRFSVECIRKAKSNRGCVKWDEEHRNTLLRLGVYRILKLKQELVKSDYRHRFTK